jgi:hypothetical protein
MKRLWIVLAVVLTFGFTVLGWVGSRIYQEMPPIPERIVTTDGQVVAPDGTIRKGQAVWQTLGGMEVGSIWGHGSYVAPDWTANWLHRECEQILDDWARFEHARPYAAWGGAAGRVARTAAADVAGQPLRPGHGNADHGALFGVYDMLGLGLTLMCLRALQADREWKEGLLGFSFWAMNGGLMAMIALSLLPVGLLQTVASVKHGYWYSRSGEFLGQGLMQTLRWLRMPGDTLFAIGAIGFVVFVFGLGFGYSLADKGRMRDEWFFLGGSRCCRGRGAGGGHGRPARQGFEKPTPQRQALRWRPSPPCRGQGNATSQTRTDAGGPKGRCHSAPPVHLDLPAPGPSRSAGVLHAAVGIGQRERGHIVGPSC